MYAIGTKLHFGTRTLELNLTLHQVELITEPGSCGRDEFLYHWDTPEGLDFLTTSDELDGMLSDGATLTTPN